MIHRLKEIRKGLGFNQTDFAKHLGITQTAYSMIENGNRPLADKYVKIICSVFNVNEKWFLNGEGGICSWLPLMRRNLRKYSAAWLRKHNSSLC